MLVRVVTTSMAVGLVTLAGLGWFVTTEIRNGLVSASVDRLLAESAQDALSTQARADAASAQTPAELQELIYGLVASLRDVGGESRGVVIQRHPGNDSRLPVTSVAAPAGSENSISDEMRTAVQAGAAQSWQFVSVAPDGGPGAVVGATITIEDSTGTSESDFSGLYEIYFVYSLESEQATLDVIQRVLALGALVIAGFVIFLTWWVARQAVQPVRQAARVASRVAEGVLEARMPVRGYDEMSTLATTFNEMTESLQDQITRMEDLSRLQRRFVADVSHELRTPLTTVRMASDVLFESRQVFPGEAARSAELLNTQLDRFESMLADLLEISRIDAGAAHMEFDATDLTSLVRDEVVSMLPLAEDMDVELRLWGGADDSTAHVDQGRVRRIIRNLVANALEHANGQGVDILVTGTSAALAVVVRDYGQGLTAGQAERVFDRFWRADPSRRRTMGGTGLGLAIAREDAQLHGGALEAWGEEGKGASFRLMVPRGAKGLPRAPIIPVVLERDDFPAQGSLVDLHAVEVQ